jgi:hypothetical protein
MKVRMLLAATALAAAISCGSSASQHVQVAHLGFSMPSDWHNVDSNQRGLVTSVWTPDENDHKESVTVIRTERSPDVAKAGQEAIETLLTSAQYPGSKVAATTTIKTKQGMSGVQIEVDYVPPGLKHSYHRVHVVLVDGSSLVHVLYTALVPDPNLDTVNQVLASIREES